MASDCIRTSVVIPVYNGGRYLARTLDSVLNQSIADFEVICVDDGSSDDGLTNAVLEEYAQKDSRVRVLRQKNQGPSAARNFGVQESRGKYVYVCDQDDLLHPQLLEYCLWAVSSQKVDFLAFRYGYCSGNQIPEFKNFDNFDNVPFVVADQTIRGKSRLRAHIFHTDTWVHFSTRELAMSFPYALNRGMTRPFTLIRTVGRWMVSEAILYYYNSQVESSMMHRSISEKVMLAERGDWVAFCDIYSEERESGDSDGLWKQQCKKFLLQGLKIEYNMLRRSKKREDVAVHKDKMEIFVESLQCLFIEKKIPLRWVKIRHRIAYCRLMSKAFCKRIFEKYFLAH